MSGHMPWREVRDRRAAAGGTASAPEPGAASFGQVLWNGNPEVCDTCGNPAMTAAYGPAAGSRPKFGCAEHPALTVQATAGSAAPSLGQVPAEEVGAQNVLPLWEPQPAPGLEAAFTSGMRVRTASCTVDDHDGEHFQVRTNGHWLCGHLLASLLIAQGIIADPEPQPAPGALAVSFRDERGQELAKTTIWPDRTRKVAIPIDAEHMLLDGTRDTPAPASASQVRRLTEQQGGPPNDAWGPESQAAPEPPKILTADSRWVAMQPQPAPELAAAMTESRELRRLLETP